jgi:hypothetical protein
MDWILLIPAAMASALVWLTVAIYRERMAEWNKPRPTYYVKHPDDSFTEADPQPR